MGWCTYKGLTFEWDDDKKNANPVEHDGITFEEAFDVFLDPGLVMVDASRNGESRDAVIGYGAKDRLLFAVFIERGEGESFRIISVFKAEAKYRKLYEEGS